jgi:hypothetical protein
MSNMINDESNKKNFFYPFLNNFDSLLKGQPIITKSVLMQTLTNFSKDLGMGRCGADSLNSSQDKRGI